MSKDVTRLGAAAVKRRYPPGMVPGQQHEEITLVQSDIEGSTEIWEWYRLCSLCSVVRVCVTFVIAHMLTGTATCAATCAPNRHVVSCLCSVRS